MKEPPEKDANEIAAELVRDIHRASMTRGEDLLGSEELKRELREAKEREAKRQKGKN